MKTDLVKKSQKQSHIICLFFERKNAKRATQQLAYCLNYRNIPGYVIILKV